MTGAFAGMGSTVICGGARSTYENCATHAGDKRICSHNVECVETAGGAEWCTGPKTTDCYSYNIIANPPRWEKTADLLEARAYASHVVLPSGKVGSMNRARGHFSLH